VNHLLNILVLCVCVQLLLPPKYEDIANVSGVDTATVDAEAPPPAYAAR